LEKITINNTLTAESVSFITVSSAGAVFTIQSHRLVTCC